MREPGLSRHSWRRRFPTERRPRHSQELNLRPPRRPLLAHSPCASGRAPEGSQARAAGSIKRRPWQARAAACCGLQLQPRQSVDSPIAPAGTGAGPAGDAVPARPGRCGSNDGTGQFSDPERGLVTLELRASDSSGTLGSNTLIVANVTFKTRSAHSPSRSDIRECHYAACAIAAC